MKRKTQNANVPSGYQELSGSQAPIWAPKAKGEFLEGTVTEDRNVDSKKGKKKISTRLLVLQEPEGTHKGIWCSAAIQQVIGKEKSVKGWKLMFVYEGLRKIKGQGNPMKMFRVFRKK